MFSIVDSVIIDKTYKIKPFGQLRRPYIVYTQTHRKRKSIGVYTDVNGCLAQTDDVNNTPAQWSNSLITVYTCKTCLLVNQVSVPYVYGIDNICM